MKNPDPGKRPATILIVHHDPETLTMYRHMVEKKGYYVETAEDGAKGIQQVYRLIPDLIIADVMIPEINGYQLCRLLKNDAVTQKIPFILVSGFDEKMNRFWGFKAGADAFVNAEEAPMKLHKQVEMLLEIYDQVELAEKKKIQSLQGQDIFNIRTRLNQILDKALIESTLANEFRNLHDLAHDRSLLDYMFFSLLENVIQYDLGAVFYNDKSVGPRTVCFNVPEGRTVSEATVETLKSSFFEQFNAAERGDTRRFETLEAEVIGEVTEGENAEAGNPEGAAAQPDYKTVYVKKYFIRGELAGALAFYAKGETDFSEIFPVPLIEHEVKLLMNLRYMFSQAEMLTVTDDLTGLFNYSHLMSAVDREFKRAQRYELDLSIAMIDIDHFKTFNETHGHLAGDELLKTVARAALDSFRGSDFVARYSAEELLVIFPETPLDDAKIACERFRKAVESIEGDVRATVSIGITRPTEVTGSVQQLLHQAKDALANAQKQGGNRLEL